MLIKQLKTNMRTNNQSNGPVSQLSHPGCLIKPSGFNGQTVGSVYFQAGTQMTPALAGIAGREVAVEVCGSQE